ncbi:Protein LSM12 like protein A, partial [Melipona quadrifasciata]
TVACKTCYKEEIEGEVLAFDPQTKMLILKVQVKREVSPTTSDPPQSLNLQKLNRRVRNQIEEKKKLVMALQAGVSPEGQKLFSTISKTIPEITWSGANIVVFDNVTIRPPYKVDNVHGNTESGAYKHNALHGNQVQIDYRNFKGVSSPLIILYEQHFGNLFFFTSFDFLAKSIIFDEECCLFYITSCHTTLDFAGTIVHTCAPMQIINDGSMI